MFVSILILHILGAAVWVGGHLILSITILPAALRSRDPQMIRDFEMRYERIGVPALLVQVITGLWLAHRMLPSPAAWFAFDSYVATHIAAKLGLLVVTVGLAIDARVRIIPRLAPENLSALAWHIIPVTILAVLFVVMGVGLRTGGIF